MATQRRGTGVDQDGDQRSPHQDLLDDLVRRIVAAVQPERIVLFGSAATGRLGPNSDLDVLVIKSGQYRRLDVLHEIRRSLRGFGWPVDLIVATPEEVDRYKESFSLVYHAALKEGRELYAG
jgi:uncharacterized protein